MTTTLSSSSLVSVTMPTSTQVTSGMGLLTTVAQLPAKYKIRYLARTAMIESPLDLTVKQQLQQQQQQQQQQHQQTTSIVLQTKTTTTTTTTNLPPSNNCSSVSNNNNPSGPITPPPSPPKKRYREDTIFITNINNIDDEIPLKKNPKIITNDKEISPLISKELITPPKQLIRLTSTAPKTTKSHPNIPKDKKIKAIRKLKFDEETSSPVSGTIIRPIEEILENIDEHQSGDIDPQYNIVEITDEAKSELAAIRNVIGAYVCKLCRIEYDDAFGLAQHRCSCIVLLEYRCPECGKRFNCPANLASHRRWHKPKEEVLRKQQENQENEQLFPCTECGKQFKRQAYLRKHLTTHKHRENDNNKNGEEKSTIGKQKLNKKKLITSVSNSNSRTNSSLTNSMNSIGDDCSSQSSSISSQFVRDNPQSIQSSYNDTRIYKYDSDLESESRSDCSSPGRLQIIENNMTEEENIAATALAHLRNGPSVIQHTHATMAF